MIKSGLRQLRTTKTVTVKTKTLSGGQYSETTVSGLSNLTATYYAKMSMEVATDAGAVVIVSEVLGFDTLPNGTLPAIEEKHVIVEDDDTRYEVIAVVPVGGLINRLKVAVRRLR